MGVFFLMMGCLVRDNTRRGIRSQLPLSGLILTEIEFDVFHAQFPCYRFLPVILFMSLILNYARVRDNYLVLVVGGNGKVKK
jgi:hypothetical protein